MERSRAGVEILAAIERGLARDPKTLPKIERERRAGGGATVELLKVLLRQVSEKRGVAAKMIATVEDLEAIAADDNAEVGALKGWRRELFGDKALELKHGRLALTVENNRVVTLEYHRGAERPRASEATPQEFRFTYSIADPKRRLSDLALVRPDRPISFTLSAMRRTRIRSAPRSHRLAMEQSRASSTIDDGGMVRAPGKSCRNGRFLSWWRRRSTRSASAKDIGDHR